MNAPHKFNYAYTYLALSAFIFLVLNLPVPIGRLTPAASSIFNIVSSATLLSPWVLVFLVYVGKVSRYTKQLHLVVFLWFFLVVFLNVLIKLSSWTLHSHTAKQQYRLLCWTDLSSNWDKGVLYCTEKWKSHSKHCCWNQNFVHKGLSAPAQRQTVKL